MNWPNRLSVLRIALAAAVAALIYGGTPWALETALVLFVAACFTDWLDGWMARRYHIVTNFGKFIDPVADKLLVLSTMISLCGRGSLPAWACIVVLFRELAVDGLRLVAMEHGQVIAAGKLGKIKTTPQMVMLVTYLLAEAGLFGLRSSVLPELLLIAAMVMTLWSGVDYFVKNRAVLMDGGR